MKNLVMMLLLPVVLSFTSCCVQKEMPLSPEEISTIEDEVDARFHTMLNLVQKDNQEEFETYFDKSATLAVAGFEIPSKSVTDYSFEIFKSLTGEKIEFQLTNFVLSGNVVYLDIYAFRVPTDTSKGFELKPFPILIKYHSESDVKSEIKNDEPSNKRADVIYQVGYSDSTRFMKPLSFVFPIKEEKFTIIFIRNKLGWQFTHGHLSLAIKRSKIFNLVEVKPKH